MQKKNNLICADFINSDNWVSRTPHLLHVESFGTSPDRTPGAAAKIQADLLVEAQEWMKSNRSSQMAYKKKLIKQVFTNQNFQPNFALPESNRWGPCWSFEDTNHWHTWNNGCSTISSPAPNGKEIWWSGEGSARDCDKTFPLNSNVNCSIMGKKNLEDMVIQSMKNYSS